MHENRIPPKLETKYNELNFQLPKPFSRPDPIIKVETKFKHKCTKLACKNVGVINLQTCPLFFIFLASFHPNISKAFGLGAKNSVLTIFVYDKITKGRSSLQTRLSKFTAKTFYLISSSLTDFQTAEAKKKQSSYGN